MQHALLINRAKTLGISVKDVSELMQCPAAILEYNNISELIKDGVPMSWINVRSQFFCDNKQLTKLAFEALNIPHPKSIIFSEKNISEIKSDELINSFLKNGKKYVCKPLDSTNGIGVEMGIENIEMIKAYFEKYENLNTPFLLEEQISGADLRIHVIGGEIVAACIREPAFVIGDGKNTLENLIEKRRAVMKMQNPNNFLEIDEATKKLLREQNISLFDIPIKNRKIKLKYVSNMAQGGIATDVTDSIHPTYQKWTTALSDYLGTGYMGLDFITTDFKKEAANHSWLLEINARADWLHHTFSEKRTHDMAGIILKNVFGKI